MSAAAAARLLAWPLVVCGVLVAVACKAEELPPFPPGAGHGRLRRADESNTSLLFVNTPIPSNTTPSLTVRLLDGAQQTTWSSYVQPRASLLAAPFCRLTIWSGRRTAAPTTTAC